MKIFENLAKDWSLLKYGFNKAWLKFHFQYYSEKECLFAYEIGEKEPESDYVMYFPKEFKTGYIINEQYKILKSTTSYQATEWLRYNYLRYNNKSKYLDYFERGIQDFIVYSDLKEKETVSLRSCLEWISQEREKLKADVKDEQKNKIIDLVQKIDRLYEANEKLQNEKKILEETLLAERKIYRDLETKNIELNVALEAKITEIEILNNSNLTFSSLLDPKNSKLPKITLPNYSYEMKAKIIQYIDLLNVGTNYEKKGKIEKLGVLEFENDKAFVRILKIIFDVKDTNDSTLGTDITKARHDIDKKLGKVPDELIKWAKVHFGIEK